MCSILNVTSWEGYPQRTEWNVRDSDGTLILTRGEPDGGTALTRELTLKWKRPCLVIRLDEAWDLDAVHEWLKENAIATLNVAGPRESSAPQIGHEARQFLLLLLS